MVKDETAARPEDDDHSLSREELLNRALDGGMSELPPNQVKGLLGETNPKLKVTDDFTPDLNAGVSQEMDLPVVWMGVVLAYLVFFPVAYYILWRSSYFSLRAKVVVSVIGAAGIAYVGFRLIVG